jgi:hypothetical protein
MIPVAFDICFFSDIGQTLAQRHRRAYSFHRSYRFSPHLDVTGKVVTNSRIRAQEGLFFINPLLQKHNYLNLKSLFESG